MKRRIIASSKSDKDYEFLLDNILDKDYTYFNSVDDYRNIIRKLVHIIPDKVAVYNILVDYFDEDIDEYDREHEEDTENEYY